MEKTAPKKSILIITKLNLSGGEYSSKEFYDHQFPPLPSSIYNTRDEGLSEKETSVYKRLKWVKGLELKRQPDNGHIQEINPGDIKQGNLGNCAFLSAIASLAQYPDRIKNLFVNQQTNMTGLYLVKLFVNGLPQTIAIDDKVPIDTLTGSPVFAQNAGNKLWVIFMEKAWAKVNGNYCQSQSKSSFLAFNFLTGAPCFYYNNRKEAALWTKLVTADHMMHIITSSCSEKENAIEKEKIGLVTKHAYSIISVHIVKCQGREQKLLKIRNPWGKQEWKGNWSKNYPFWTPELKAQLGFVNYENGEFFISFEDYIKYFDMTTICAYQDWYKRTYLTAKQKAGQFCLFKFTVPKINGSDSQQQIYISVYQLYKAFAMQTLKQSDYDYPITNIMIGKIDLNDKRFPVQFVDGQIGLDYQTSIDLMLSPGIYIVVVDCEFKHPTVIDEFCISIYAPEKIDIQEVEPKKEYIGRLLKSCAYKKSKRETYSQLENNKNAFYCMDLCDSGCGYGYVYVHNDTENQIRKNIQFKILTGYSLLDYNNQRTIDLKIPAFSSEIVVLKPIGNQKRQINWTYSLKEIHSNDKLKEYAVKNGKFEQIKVDNQYYDIFKYYGYTKSNTGFLLIQNKSKNTKFIGQFDFDLENLKIVDENQNQQPSKVKLIVMPQESKLLKLEIVDENKLQVRFSMSSRFLCIENMDKSQIISKVKGYGKKQQITYHNQQKQIFYYVHYLGGNYYWYFENLERQKCSFHCTVKFTSLQNLRLDNMSNQWDVILQNGENMLLTIYQIKPTDFLPVDYKTSMTFQITNL